MQAAIGEEWTAQDSSLSAEVEAGEHGVDFLAVLVVRAVQEAEIFVERFEDFGGGAGVVLGQQERADVAA